MRLLRTALRRRAPPLPAESAPFFFVLLNFSHVHPEPVLANGSFCVLQMAPK